MLDRLTRREEFLACAGDGRKAGSAGLMLQARAHDARQHPPGWTPGAPVPLRIGLTTSRKVGKAVQRNRARRRLRALAQEVMADRAAPGHDYVLIGRTATIDRPWESLRRDLISALGRLQLLLPAPVAEDEAAP